jgi:hypothetical protein
LRNDVRCSEDWEYAQRRGVVAEKGKRGKGREPSVENKVGKS